jgi:hypothetical protein
MIPVYHGQPRQYGYGLGSMFKKMASSIIPFVKPLVKSGLNTLKREGLRQGIGVAQDVLSGESVEEAFKQRGKDLLKNVRHKAVSGIKRAAVKRKHHSRPRKPQRHKLRKTARPLDIFD